MPLQCELDLIQAELSHFICRSFNSLKTICYEYETNWFVSVFTWTDNKKTKQLTQRFLVTGRQFGYFRCLHPEPTVQ